MVPHRFMPPAADMTSVIMAGRLRLNETLHRHRTGRSRPTGSHGAARQAFLHAA